jgi:ribosomal protein S10
MFKEKKIKFKFQILSLSLSIKNIKNIKKKFILQKIKKITILRSPFVNKKSRNQLEFRYFKINLNFVLNNIEMNNKI